MNYFKSDKSKLLLLFRTGCREKGKIAVLSAISAATSLLSVIRARFYELIINSVAPGVSFDKGFFATAAAFGVTVIAALLLYQAFRYISEGAVTDMYNRLRRTVMAHLLKAEYGEINRFHSGDILTRMFSDARIVSENTVNVLPNLVELVILLVGSAVYLFFISRPFCLILVIFGIIMMLSAAALRKVLKRLHSRAQAAEGEVRSLYQERLSGILMIKVFGAEKKVLAEADEKQRAYRERTMKKQLASCLLNFCYLIGCNGVLVLTFFYAVYGIKEGFLTYGALTAMLQLAGNIQESVVGLGGVLPKLYSAAASAERVCEITALPEEKVTGQALTGVKEINFCDVSFSYGERRVFENINLNIKSGESVAIQGPSGIGKSTLILLLLGIYPPSGGCVTLSDGTASTNAGLNTRNLFSYTPQGNGLFSGTVAENVAFSKSDASEDEIITALKAACAYDFVSSLPDGLNTRIGERGTGLSEGQCQRIAIARAILSPSSVLLFDEATSALDEETEGRLIGNLKAMGKTSVFITHRKSPLSVCSAAYVVTEDGIKKVK